MHRNYLIAFSMGKEVPRMAENKNPAENGRKATIYDIASRANVSTTTVHKVLHNRKGVGEETRRQILDIVKELNYTRNAAAHILSRKELRIGVVVEVHNREFGQHITNGIHFAVEQLSDRKVIGYFDRLENSLGRARVLEDFRKMLESGVDGIVLFPTGPYREYEEMNPLIEKLGIPVVTINNDLPHLDSLCSVLQDGDMLGRMAGSLMNMCNPRGHSAVFIGSKDVLAQGASMNRFAETLEAHGGEMTVAYETQVENRIGYVLTENLVENYPDVNGIFVGVSQCLGVIERLKEMNALHKFRIITVDTYPEVMEHLKSGNIVATLDRHPFRMGQAAIHVLYQYLVNDIRPERHILVHPNVVLPAVCDQYPLDGTHPLDSVL